MFLKSIQNQNILPYLPLNIKKYTDIEGKRRQNDIEFTTITRIALQLIATEAAITKIAFCKYFKS